MRLNKINKKLKRCLAAVLSLIVLFSATTEYVKTENVIAAEDDFNDVLAKFPKSYQSYLKSLHEKYPKWNFVPFETGLDWEEVIKNEMFLTRNLVPNDIMTLGGVDDSWYKTPTSWKEIKLAGAFDWTGNAWVEYSGGGWVQASTEAVEYVMDPRNWLTENNVFMFEQLSYNSEYQTISVLKKMMDDTFMDCDYATVGGSSKKTYAEVLKEAAVKYNVSPVLLCARLMQEKGRGKYSESKEKYLLDDILASGLATDDGGKTFRKATSSDTKVYYNFFNIGASGLTYDDVINNGGKEAMAEGWTSQYKAIIGGAKKIAVSDIDLGQDTLYFQKFSVVDEDNLYWHQYMQNLLAPVNEGYTTMKTYNENGMLDTAFTFRIPVYKNMPSTPCARPKETDNTGNPNYKLKSLSVISIEEFSGKTAALKLDTAFNRDKGEYTATVPYKITSIKVSASAIASTSKISGTGDIPLNVGKNEINIRCRSEYGSVKTYKLIITRKEGSTYLTKLKATTGKWSKDFFKGTFEYSLYVKNSASQIRFSLGRESEVALVELKYNGVTTTVSGKKTPMINLKEGKNVVYINVYPSPKDKSSVSTYKINVIRYTNVVFSKKKLQSKGEYIRGFAVGDTVKKAISRMSVKEGKIYITDSKNNKKSESEIICTGDKVIVYDLNGYKYKEYKIVIYGDINKDGCVDVLDYEIMKNHYFGESILTDIKLEAGNLVGKTVKITSSDLTALRKYVWAGTKYKQTK